MDFDESKEKEFIDYVWYSKEIIEFLSGGSKAPTFDDLVDYAIANGKHYWIDCMLKYTQFFVEYINSYNAE